MFVFVEVQIISLLFRVRCLERKGAAGIRIDSTRLKTMFHVSIFLGLVSTKRIN